MLRLHFTAEEGRHSLIKRPTSLYDLFIGARGPLPVSGTVSGRPSGLNRSGRKLFEILEVVDDRD